MGWSDVSPSRGVSSWRALMRPKSLHRFCVEPAQISGGRVRFSSEQTHQIVRVLRMRLGDTLAVFDGTGAEHEAELITLSDAEVTARLKRIRATVPEPALRLTLLQGLPRAEKMELIVQKATELGVYRIVPLLCARSVSKGFGRLQRWRTIAREAAEQCGRAVVPTIGDPVPFTGFFGAEGGAALRGIALWEDEQRRSVREALKLMVHAEPMHLLVGPEGGLEPDEVSLAGDRGLVTASLGRRTLRTETATLVALGVIQYELGDLGLSRGS
jgi:16S rRNA (uracil1498-N3)-methyltransferase